MDGWVTVGTKLDTKQLERDIKKSEKELENYKKNSEKLTDTKAKIEADVEIKGKELDRKIKEIENKAQIDIKAVTGGSISSRAIKEQKIQETAQLKINGLQQQYNEYLDKTNIKIDNIEQQIAENVSKQEVLNNQIDEMNEKLGKSKGLGNIKDTINQASNSMSGILKKVAKWSLAIFSVRSAYNFIRGSISTISQYNEDLANQIEYIRYALASVLEPVVRGIVNLVAKLLQYVNYIWKEWTGNNLFKSADAFNEMKNSSKETAKNVKEINKQLAGFDEMNVLEDTSKTATATSGGETIAPSIDLTEIEGEPPAWIKWIAENKDTVLDFFKQLGAIIGVIGIAKLLDNFGLLQPIIGLVTKGISGLITTFKNLGALRTAAFIGGIVLAFSGLVSTVKAVIEFIKNPSWENFNKILEGLVVTLAGVSLAMIAFNATNPVGWIILAVDAVLAVITILSTLTQKLFEDKAAILDTKEAQEQLTEAREKARQANDDYISSVDNAEEAEKRLADAEAKTGISGEELFKKVQNGTLDYKNMTEAQREVYKAYLNNQDAQNKLKTATDNLNQAKEDETNAYWENELAMAKESGSYEDLKNKIIKANKEQGLSIEKTRDTLERAMGGMDKKSRETFLQSIPEDIRSGLDPSKYQSTGSKIIEWFQGIGERAGEFFSGLGTRIGDALSGALKAVLNGALRTLEGLINLPIDIINGALWAINLLPGVYVPYISKVYLPRLAKGGVISQPGRGVPVGYGQAIAGEGGTSGSREGVIPLTDAQQMALLGESIGKYVNINLTNITKLDNRQIAKEQKRISAQNDFAFNR